MAGFFLGHLLDDDGEPWWLLNRAQRRQHPTMRISNGQFPESLPSCQPRQLVAYLNDGSNIRVAPLHGVDVVDHSFALAVVFRHFSPGLSGHSSIYSTRASCPLLILFD